MKSSNLVRSSLKKGDAVIAMDKSSKACYKISVETQAYTDNTKLNETISAYAKARRDFYDQIAKDLQRGNKSFITPTQSQIDPNRVNASCFDRFNTCNFSLGRGEAKEVKLLKSVTLPASDFNNAPGRDSKIEIYGPSKDGLYMVRHINRGTWGRSFLVQDPKYIQQALQAIKDYEHMFRATKEDFEKKFAKEAKTIKHKPVLDIQRMENSGKLQSSKIDLDPSKPFAKIAELNKKYDYYNISCTETFNPLKPKAEPQNGVVKQDELRAEPAVMRGTVPRYNREQAIDI